MGGSVTLSPAYGTDYLVVNRQTNALFVAKKFYVQSGNYQLASKIEQWINIVKLLQNQHIVTVMQSYQLAPNQYVVIQQYC